MTFREPLQLYSARHPAVPAGGGIVGGCTPRLRLCAYLGVLHRCARCRSGGRSFCRALKSPTGAFSLAPLCQPPPLRRGSLAARPLRGCGVVPPPAPPSRSTSALVRLSARAAQALVPRALACRSLARFFRSLRLGRARSFGAAACSRCAVPLALCRALGRPTRFPPSPAFSAAPAPRRGALAVAPAGSPARVGALRAPRRPIPPRRGRRCFFVSRRCALRFPFSALRRRGHHPPPA